MSFLFPLFNTKNVPWSLVLTSMLLLTLFVGYWNYVNYTNEKKQLISEVEAQLALAYSEVKDGYLANELFHFVHNQASDSLASKSDSFSITMIIDTTGDSSPKHDFFGGNSEIDSVFIFDMETSSQTIPKEDGLKFPKRNSRFLREPSSRV